jgi:hypothetical protein
VFALKALLAHGAKLDKLHVIAHTKSEQRPQSESNANGTPSRPDPIPAQRFLETRGKIDIVGRARQADKREFLKFLFLVYDFIKEDLKKRRISPRRMSDREEEELARGALRRMPEHLRGLKNGTVRARTRGQQEIKRLLDKYSTGQVRDYVQEFSEAPDKWAGVDSEGTVGYRKPHRRFTGFQG